MSRISYVNGQYVAHNLAQIHVEDRGNQFADGVYEVIAVAQTQLLDSDLHFDRLERSLHELKIAMPLSRRVLYFVSKEIIRRNKINKGMIYIQISRGIAPRNHAFPEATLPSIILIGRHAPQESASIQNGVRVILTNDIRWGRCDIKSISLLPNVLAKQEAIATGAYEAWLVDPDGFVTEGSSSNAWILDGKGVLRTGPLGKKILSGITRKILTKLAEKDKILLKENQFSISEALNAEEAMLSSTSNFLLPVIQINDKIIGKGVPGPVTKRLIQLFEEHVGSQT